MGRTARHGNCSTGSGWRRFGPRRVDRLAQAGLSPWPGPCSGTSPRPAVGADRRPAPGRPGAAPPEPRPGHPEGVRHFDNLAAAQIRRELIDLARRYHGPEGLGADHHTDGPTPVAGWPRSPKGADRPESLEEWAAFHEAVDRLPEEERRGNGTALVPRADARPGRRSARRGNEDSPAAVGLGAADDPVTPSSGESPT